MPQQALNFRPEPQGQGSLRPTFATRRPDAAVIAAAQAPLFHAMAERTRDDPALRDYHRNYSGWAKEMDGLVRRASGQPDT